MVCHLLGPGSSVRWHIFLGAVLAVAHCGPVAYQDVVVVITTAAAGTLEGRLHRNIERPDERLQSQPALRLALRRQHMPRD